MKPDGQAIRAFRESRGLTSGQLAKLCGSHRNGSSIRNLEIQDWRAGKFFVQQVAKALKVDISEITVAEAGAGVAA